jgi:para-aminobenzoate synthetase/4-amino-4-deoxychorismate lyase
MRYSPERGLRNRDRHLRRLAGSAEHLGFRCDPPTIEKELGVRLTGHGPCRVRLRLRRNGAVVVEVSPLPPPAQGPVTLAVDTEPVDSRSSWLCHKTTVRSAYECRGRRHPDVDDVVMVNERGELTEVTRANLALRLRGRWWTPPLASGCLPGVERARLLDRHRLAERVLHVPDLHRAEAIAVVSSLRGWRPAVLHAGP